MMFIEVIITAVLVVFVINIIYKKVRVNNHVESENIRRNLDGKK